jgi:hypothetical protein
MTKRAAIRGALVDVRNASAHKAVRLTVEVPAELAEEVLGVFGWPTGVRPVPVAVARMQDEPEQPTAPPTVSLAQHAGALCRDAIFQRFLGAADYDDATRKVRERCAVVSRSEFVAGTPAGERWRTLVEEFHGWQAAERSGAR